MPAYFISLLPNSPAFVNRRPTHMRQSPRLLLDMSRFVIGAIVDVQFETDDLPPVLNGLPRRSPSPRGLFPFGRELCSYYCHGRYRGPCSGSTRQTTPHDAATTHRHRDATTTHDTVPPRATSQRHHDTSTRRRHQNTDTTRCHPTS